MPRETGEVLSYARAQGSTALVGRVSGKLGWCAEVPPGSACEECVQVPAIDEAANPGLYFPLVEYASTWLSTAVVDAVLNGAKSMAFVESFDANHSPWMRQTRDASPRPGCPKCNQKT